MRLILLSLSSIFPFFKYFFSDLFLVVLRITDCLRPDLSHSSKYFPADLHSPTYKANFASVIESMDKNSKQSEKRLKKREVFLSDIKESP